MNIEIRGGSNPRKADTINRFLSTSLDGVTMKIKSFSSVLSSLFIGLLAISFSTHSVAAPFSITYTGTIGTENTTDLFPEVNEGEGYSLTLIFDNGSSDALSQEWVEADLTCAIFIINDAGDVQFSQDLTLDPVGSSGGSILTDGAGVLSGNFDHLVYGPVTATSYMSTGIALTDPIDWYANDNNDVFFINDVDNTAFGDAAGGILMAPANWTDPIPYSGTCGVTAPPPVEPPPPAAPIPATSQWALIMLSMLLGLVVFVHRRHLF